MLTQPEESYVLNSLGESATQDSVEKDIPQTQNPTYLVLGGLLHQSSNMWAVWINGAKYSPAHCKGKCGEHRFSIQSVQSDCVEIRVDGYADAFRLTPSEKICLQTGDMSS